jgi:rsbT co-antagonist protein RsbR
VSTPAPGLELETWYTPLRGPGGEVQGAACLTLDVSDRIARAPSPGEADLVERQSATIRALATPIIQVWDGVLCLPVIGTVDSARTAEMMQRLLDSIVKEHARYAIVDLTGVELVDTSTADHLIQLFRAARVLGVEGVLCGIRPAVAQTIVGLGLDLGSVRTTRSLRDALKWCIRARGTATEASHAASQET